MAEEKNSFLVYTDTITTIEKLSNEQAGLLFKTMLRYTNDLNPTIDDFVVEIAFEPIKQQLKRDLKTWGKSKAKKSEGGQVGNLKRWNPDLYEKYMKKELTLDQCTEIIQSRIVSHTDRSDLNENKAEKSPNNTHLNSPGESLDRIPIKNIASVAVSDSVSVSVSVSGSVIEKENKEKILSLSDFSNCDDSFKNLILGETGVMVLGNEETKIKKSKIIDDLVSWFEMTPQPFHKERSAIMAFVNLQDTAGMLDHLIDQFENYKAFKHLAGNKHSLFGFIGTQAEQFSNGKWNSSNWAASLKNHLDFNAPQNKTQQSKPSIQDNIDIALKAKNPFRTNENE